MVSVDVYRPAARKQIERARARSEAADLRRYARRNQARRAGASARARKRCRPGATYLLVDTAGRLHIDEELMTELSELKEQLNPVEILFVADAMTGQDAVKSADEFHKRLGITGVILTKMDGDARGGAALSIRAVTGQPLKFVGVGEKPDALRAVSSRPRRPAHSRHGRHAQPDREGRGDLSIRNRAEEMQRKLIEDEFTLGDFRDQMKQLRKLGPLESILGMMPQIWAAEGTEERQDRREGDHAPGGDHRFHDPARARQSHDHQRRAAPADRQGQRHHRCRK